MKQQTSQTKPNTGGYVRICCDCSGDMQWRWGGPITYFQCEKCVRIEPCANVIVDRESGTVRVEEGNKNTVFAFRPDEWEKVMSIAMKGQP